MKRNAKNFSGSNFDYTLQNGNHQMVVRQNYKEQEKERKNFLVENSRGAWRLGGLARCVVLGAWCAFSLSLSLSVSLSLWFHTAVTVITPENIQLFLKKYYFCVTVHALTLDSNNNNNNNPLHLNSIPSH